MLSGGDEHDEIGASDNGRWWVIARYPSNRVVRVNVSTGTVDKVPGLRRHTGAAYTIDDAGHVGRPGVAPARTDLLVDRTEQGHQLSARGHTVYLSERPGIRGRPVAGGYPRTEVEQEPSFSNGSLSESGEIVTLPTVRSYDPDDRNHGVDVYQFDLGTGLVTWVSRRSVFGGNGVAASPSGRYVVFDGALHHDGVPGATTGTTGDTPLRWDRRSGRTTYVPPGRTTGPTHGVTSEFSVADDGSTAFVANDCDLTAQKPPPGALTCLYISTPAPGRRG